MLLFVVVLVAMMLVSYAEGYEESIAIVDLFSLLFYVAILGIPATFYLYTISLSDIEFKNVGREKTLKHYFIPLLLLVINVFSFLYLSNKDNENDFIFQVSENVMNYANFIAILFVFPVLNCIYIYKTIKKYRAHKKKITQVFSYQKGVDLKWMFYYILGYCFFIVSVYLIQGYSNILAVFIPTAFFLTAYLLYVGILGSVQKQVVFEKRIFGENKGFLKGNSNLEEKADFLKERIHDVMKEEPFLNKSLTIHEFSKLVGSNSKYVSAFLNSEFQQNFSTFINSHRVHKAKKMLASELASKYTIETIGENVGFHSKSAFNGAFKNIAGMTPSQYRKKFLR